MKQQIKKMILGSDKLLRKKAPFVRRAMLQLLRQLPALHMKLAALQPKDFELERSLCLPRTINALSPDAARILQRLSQRLKPRRWWS